MARRLLLSLLALCFAVPSAAQAAEPPNQNDPCAKNHRNSCDTAGVGSYRTYRYGLRWFGDYRGAVPDVDGGTFCIDLRFWYPGKQFRYVKRSAAGLKNKDGRSVPALKLRRMNRALWRYGRSNNAAQQGAVMVYVHQLMGDGAPGEAEPKALSAAGRRAYAALRRDAERFAGPYTVRATVEKKLVAGRATDVTIEVLTASGRRVPGVKVALSATGAADVPDSVSTGDSGTAKLSVVPNDPQTGLVIDARAAELPATLPALYVPTRGQSARNGQRLVQAATTSVRAQAKADVQVAPQVVTQISAQAVKPGTAVTDTVKVSGLQGQTATVQAALYGPYAQRDQITCADAPVWTGTITATGDGDYVTAPVTLQTPGYYTYRESIAETPAIAGTETACAEAAETTIVRGVPAIQTQVSAQETTPGAQITDTAIVTGLGKLNATVNVELWGPFESREAIRCEGTPAWTGTFAAAGDGTYTTEPVTLGAAGYYTYRESIAATEAYDGVVTACGEVSETTFAKAAPQVTTQVSSAVVRPGAQLTDKLTVTGLGQTPATVEVELFGPYASRADIDCAGHPYWRGSVAVTGDGTFTTEAATVKRVGFYVYRERIAETPTISGQQSECAVEAETSLAAPQILTGRGDVVAEVRAQAAQTAARPTQVRVARLGIRASVSPIGIDLRAGALGIPENIRRVGWWRDGAAPGDQNGTVLLAGHVDSAKRGAGAFYALKSARRGDIVSVRAGGKTVRYRVTTIRRMPKAQLPTSIYTRGGPRRLVLVTCGGPFNSRTGHYRDNIVVTAVPA